MKQRQGLLPVFHPSPITWALLQDLKDALRKILSGPEEVYQEIKRSLSTPPRKNKNEVWLGGFLAGWQAAAQTSGHEIAGQRQLNKNN